MPVTFLGFKVKFSPAFDGLLQPQFDLLLPDAVADVNRYNWQVLGTGWEGFRDRATENLLACNLSAANPEYLGSAGLAEFEVREAGYRVKYLSNSGGQRNNPYCLEYARLLGLLQNAIDLANPNKSGLPAGTVGIAKKIIW